MFITVKQLEQIDSYKSIHLNWWSWNTLGVKYSGSLLTRNICMALLIFSITFVSQKYVNPTDLRWSYAKIARTQPICHWISVQISKAGQLGSIVRFDYILSLIKKDMAQNLTLNSVLVTTSSEYSRDICHGCSIHSPNLPDLFRDWYHLNIHEA